MRQTAFALLLGSFLAAGLPAADQQLVNMVMPDAKVVAGINVASVRNSSFGSFLLRQASGTYQELQKFVTLTGFNPQTDLDEILIATLGSSAAPSDMALVTGGAPAVHGLILARGNFNIEKISALSKTDGHQKVQTYNGATFILDPKDMHASAMAFVSSNLVVVGDLAGVKAAVDRRSQANVLDPALTTKLNALSASQDAWAVSIAPLGGINTGPATDLQGALAGDLFKKITQTSGGIKFGDQIQLSTEMVAQDEKNATALGDVVRFLVGMATLNSGAVKGAPPALMSVLQNLSIKAQGNVLNLSLSAPEDQVESWINSMQPQAPAPGAKI